MSNRILIFANTPWEADALTAVFVNARARPTGFPIPISPASVNIPSVDGSSSKTITARLTYPDIEVWCVSDLLVSGYSTKEKARVLPYVANNGAPPSLVIAFGTAAFPDPSSYDGCVVVGSNVFIYSPPEDVLGNVEFWDDPSIGRFMDHSSQSINAPVFQSLRNELRLQIETRFLLAPVDSIKAPILIQSPGYTAISDVNVANPDDYAWADADSVRAFATAAPRHIIGSVETTHGVINVKVRSKQFLFVSAIANRLGYFNMEAAPRNYAQDFAVAHNAAVALAWMIPVVVASLASAPASLT